MEIRHVLFVSHCRQGVESTPILNLEKSREVSVSLGIHSISTRLTVSNLCLSLRCFWQTDFFFIVVVSKILTAFFAASIYHLICPYVSNGLFNRWGLWCSCGTRFMFKRACYDVDMFDEKREVISVLRSSGFFKSWGKWWENPLGWGPLNHQPHIHLI